MSSPELTRERDDFLERLLDVVEQIARTGDLRTVPQLLEMTADHPRQVLLSSLAEAFARMVVKLEAREFQLEGTIEDLRRIKEELELANYDPLTGLPNRVIARDRLSQGLHHAHRASVGLAVMYLDLDRFKWVNDNLGHLAGDELLQQVARRLCDCVRETDTVARLGGDEFLCIMPDIEDTSIARELAERFVAVLGRPFELQAGPASIGTSVGISLCPEHGATVDTLIDCADKALYLAKGAGRNCYRLYGTT